MEHHVYFWLKAEHQEDESRDAFEKGLEALLKSPNVARGTWGKPAATAERPVTDHSWDYAISFAFDSMEAHDRYQSDEDAVHSTFVNTFKDWWGKVLVMDLD